MGIVVLGMFSLHLKKHAEFKAESQYLVEPKTEEEIAQELKDLADANIPTTNKAFNEDQEFKQMMKNFKTVSSDDFERTTAEETASNESDVTEELSTNDSYSDNNGHALKKDEKESFNKLKDILKKRSDNVNQADEHASGNSTLTYSLKDRVLKSYKTPRYLCEEGGKIVVSIQVNQNGEVIDASINGASTASDQCLIDHALDYAKTVRFNEGTKPKQIGTITFLFRAKN